MFLLNLNLYFGVVPSSLSRSNDLDSEDNFFVEHLFDYSFEADNDDNENTNLVVGSSKSLKSLQQNLCGNDELCEEDQQANKEDYRKNILHRVVGSTNLRGTFTPPSINSIQSFDDVDFVSKVTKLAIDIWEKSNKFSLKNLTKTEELDDNRFPREMIDLDTPNFTRNFSDFTEDVDNSVEYLNYSLKIDQATEKNLTLDNTAKNARHLSACNMQDSVYFDSFSEKTNTFDTTNLIRSTSLNKISNMVESVYLDAEEEIFDLGTNHLIDSLAQNIYLNLSTKEEVVYSYFNRKEETRNVNKTIYTTISLKLIENINEIKMFEVSFGFPSTSFIVFEDLTKRPSFNFTARIKSNVKPETLNELNKPKNIPQISTNNIFNIVKSPEKLHQDYLTPNMSDFYELRLLLQKNFGKDNSNWCLKT